MNKVFITTAIDYINSKPHLGHAYEKISADVAARYQKLLGREPFLIFGVFYIGYYLVILMAEISAIPESYYEAASIDGASAMQQDLFITLPWIRGAILTCLTLSTIYGLRQFEQVWLMTNGGPANSTSVIVLYLYNKFQDFNFGLANTAVVVLIGSGFGIIMLLRKVFASKDTRITA